MYTCPHCHDEFELEKADDIRIFNVNARTLSIKCPACNKNFRLNKADSKILFEKFPELEEEVQKVKNEKVTKDLDPDEIPVGDFEEKFRDALSIYGLDSNKFKNKINAICKLIERTGSTKEWLRYHMQRLSFTNQRTIESVVDLVYLDDGEQGIIPPYPTNSQGRSGCFTQQPLPGGGVLLIPAMQQPQNQYPGQPIIINPGGNQGDRQVRESNDDGTITEILDDEGKVTKRIIKGGARRADTEDKSEGQILSVITMLKEIGVIPSQQQRTEAQTTKVPDEIRQTLDQLKDAITVMSSSMHDRPSKSENEDIKRMEGTVNKLTEQLQQNEKEKKDNETKSLKDGLSRVEGMIAGLQDHRGGDMPVGGLSDTQFGQHTQHKNLETISDSVTHMGDRITYPLNEILKNQQKMNSLLLVRDIEKQDNVPPGTYMKVLMPAVSPGEGEVKATVQKWQEKAAASAGAK